MDNGTAGRLYRKMLTVQAHACKMWKSKYSLIIIYEMTQQDTNYNCLFDS